MKQPFVISDQPMLVGEILRRNAIREKDDPLFRGKPFVRTAVHTARLGDHEVVESNLPISHPFYFLRR